MPESRLYMEKRVSEAHKVNPGQGSVVVDIPFVPDFIRVKFLDTCTKATPDTLSHDLIFTGNPQVPYQMTINWSVTSGKPRRFRYTAAKLASFHNGVNK